MSGVMNMLLGARTTIAAAVDAFFNQVTLLLPGDGTNGAQNNTFLDSSTNNFTITRNGNTTQGTFSPFSQTGWGLLTNDRSFLQIPASSDFDLINTDFTVEFWFNLNAFNTQAFSGNNLFGNGLATATNGWTLEFDGSGNTATSLGFRVFNGGTQTVNTFSGLTLNMGTWYHIALQRNGTGTGNLRLFVNGVLQGSAVNSVTYSTAGSVFNLGSGAYTQNPTYSGNSNYYLSNVRLTKAAVYNTSGFTSPTSNLSQISGTTLLICQSNRLINNGTNTGAITSDGFNATRAQVVPFSPFLPTIPYSAATVGGSGYFDGTGDSLSVANNSALSITGNVDASIEFWVYPISGSGVVVNKSGVSGSSFPNYSVSVNSNGSISFLLGNSGSPGSAVTTITTSAGTVPFNAWSHVVCTKTYVGGGSVNNYRVMINGILSNNGTQNNASDGNPGALTIGFEPSSTDDINAYISQLRIFNTSIPAAYQTSSTTNGTSIYTVPTTPITASTSSICTLFTNGGIIDATSDNVLETVGGVQISTAQSKFGGSSMYFDGTGDYLQVAPNPLFDLKTSDFTVEFWIYPTSFASASYPLYSQFNRSTTNAFAIEISTSGVVNVYVTNAGGAAWSIINAGNIGTLTLNTWNHVAFVRNGSAFRGYVDGTQGSLSTNSSNTVETFNGFNIGATGAGSSGYYTGYIDDFRISRYARYTASFTAPTAALPLQ